MRYLIALLAFALVFSAVIVDASVVNSPHDIAWPLSGRYVCVNCHTPHQSGQGSNTNLLWNRNRTAPTVSAYYNSATFDMGPANSTNLGPQTLLCLYCHDGAASTLVNYPGPGSTQDTNYDLAAGDIGTFANIDTDLSDDHPVAFVYDNTADNDNNGFPAKNANNAIPGNGTGTEYKLYDNDTFQCATCHSVHDTATYTKAGWNGLGNARSSSGEVYFLRTSNASSQMCNDCHVNR
jgi:hypothetical protein